MEKFVNSKIFKEMDNLVNLIKETKIYNNYLTLNNKLEENEHIKNLVNNIKTINKDLVQAEHFGRVNDIIMLEEKLEKITKDLNTIPLYNEYIKACLELSELIDGINSKMNRYFNIYK